MAGFFSVRQGKANLGSGSIVQLLFQRHLLEMGILDLHFHQFYKMKIRVVRLPLSDGNYECILTNLPQEEFSADDIKELYHMRWGIETSFRELKYSVGLTHFHSKKLDYIKQEIWARLILYNFCEARKKAIIAVARKLLVTIYTMLETGETYNPLAA